MPADYCVRCREELLSGIVPCFEILHRRKGEGVHRVCVGCYGLMHAEGKCDPCLVCPECEDEIVGHRIITGDKTGDPVYFHSHSNPGEGAEPTVETAADRGVRKHSKWKHVSKASGEQVQRDSSASSSEVRGRNKLGELQRGKGASSGAEETASSEPQFEVGSFAVASHSTDQARSVILSDRARKKLAKLRGEVPREESVNLGSLQPGAFANTSNPNYHGVPGMTQRDAAPTQRDEENGNDDTHLVEAMLVRDMSRRQAVDEQNASLEAQELDILEAREVGFMDYFRDRKLRCLCAVLAVFVCIILVVVGVMASQGETSAPFTTLLIPGVENHPYTVVALQNPDTPQAKALQWVKDHPEFEGMQNGRQQQLFAMATFAYENMATPHPTGSECFWADQDPNTIIPLEELESQCNDLGMLTSLDFAHGRLQGSIPPELVFLSSLTALDFGNNFMSKSLPSTLGELTKLQQLSLQENAFSGTLPTQYGKLTELTSLLLHTNLLSGEIPTQIEQLTQLRSLVVYDTDLAGNEFYPAFPIFWFRDPITDELARVIGPSVGEPDTPHEMALDWILNVDYMELDEFSKNLIQRYTLALFYYQTSEDRPWTSCNPPSEGETYNCTYSDMVRNPDNSISYQEQDIPEIRWLSQKHECEWAGILCHPVTDGNVIGIDIMGSKWAQSGPKLDWHFA